LDVDTEKNALVVGSRVMGGSIAQLFAGVGVAVRPVDVNEKVLERAMSLKLIKKNKPDCGGDRK